MSLDLREYLIDNYDGVPAKNRPHEISICCPECGKGDYHFSFNIVNLKGGCFCCDYRVRSAVSLISKLEGISNAKAKEYFTTGAMSDSRLSSAIKILFTSKEKNEEQYKQEDDRHTNADLPAEFIPCYKEERHPRFICPTVFNRRGYSIETIKKLNIGFCKEGYYAARIIFPITCNNMRSFYARRINNLVKQKYKNPFGSKHSLLLYNYDRLPKYCDKIFIVEGCTDVCRLTEYGYNSVATSGKKISSEQIDLLVKKEPKEVIALFDGDAVIQSEKLFKKLSYRLNASIALLPMKAGKKGEYYDPDDVPIIMLKEVIKYRYGMNRIKNVINILNNF